jgi:Aldo/keto reductase family
MNDFLARVGLGCGRLSGGVAESNSRRVMAAAVQCGIRYFDTAPSYGGGASERIVGSGLRGLRNEVQLCTKVGLARSRPNAVAELRTLVLSKIRLVLPEGAVRRLNQIRGAQVQNVSHARGYGNFDVTFVRNSVQQSLQELQTDRLDCLMLHEPSMSDPNPELAGELRGWVRASTIMRLGVATGAQFGELPQFGDVAQFALGPAMFDAGVARLLIGHGLLRGLSPEIFQRCIDEAGILERIPGLRSCLLEPAGLSALLLNAVLFGTAIDRVLVSTTSPQRLQRFMSSASNMFEEIRARGNDDNSMLFAKVVRRYFTSKAVGGDGHD